jgi:hypothetical protein
MRLFKKQLFLPKKIKPIPGGASAKDKTMVQLLHHEMVRLTHHKGTSFLQDESFRMNPPSPPLVVRLPSVSFDFAPFGTSGQAGRVAPFGSEPSFDTESQDEVQGRRQDKSLTTLSLCFDSAQHPEFIEGSKGGIFNKVCPSKG